MEIYSQNEFYIWLNIDNMKAVLFQFAVLISSIGRGQADTSIIGKWKIVSVEMAGIYYNFERDSVSLSNDVKSRTDEFIQEQIVSTVRMVHSDTEFHFEKNGIFKFRLMGNMTPGSYKIDTSQNVIEMTSKNSLNEEVADKVKYNLKKGPLSLFMEFEDEMPEYVLKKE